MRPGKRFWTCGIDVQQNVSAQARREKRIFDLILPSTKTTT